MTNYEFFNDKKINYLSHIAEKTKEIENRIIDDFTNSRDVK